MLNILMDFTTLYLKNDNAKCSNTTMLLFSSVACAKQKVPRLKDGGGICATMDRHTLLYKHMHALTYIIYIIIYIIIMRKITMLLVLRNHAFHRRSLVQFAVYIKLAVWSSACERSARTSLKTTSKEVLSFAKTQEERTSCHVCLCNLPFAGCLCDSSESKVWYSKPVKCFCLQTLMHGHSGLCVCMQYSWLATT